MQEAWHSAANLSEIGSVDLTYSLDHICVSAWPDGSEVRFAKSFPIELASLFENGADGQGTDSLVRADIVIGLKSS